MSKYEEVRSQIRLAEKKKVLFLPHALRQMMRLDSMISRLEVRQVLTQGEVIEDYPEDQRGHSCLMLGFGEGGRALHVCCSPKNEYLAIITAYAPDKHEWSGDFRVRSGR